MVKKINILGVNIDKISIDEAVSKIIAWIDDGGKHYVVTPNVEFVVLAQKDQSFKRILNDADLAIVDSWRMLWAEKMLQSNNLLRRIVYWPFFLAPKLILKKHEVVTTGTDLMSALVKVSSEKAYTVGFLGGKGNVALVLAERLKKKYPNLRIVLADSDILVDSSGEVRNWLHPDELLKHKMDILFVSFGQVKQEKWIYKNINKMDVRVMMGVGGAFDFLAGTIPRAPKIVRQIGFEWFFRLLIEPWRIKRLYRLVFFILTIFNKKHIN